MFQASQAFRRRNHSLPALLHFRIRDDVTAGTGRGAVTDPEVHVRRSPIVAEALYEYRRVVHDVRVAFDPVSELWQGTDQFAVVVGSVLRMACNRKRISRVSMGITLLNNPVPFENTAILLSTFRTYIYAPSSLQLYLHSLNDPPTFHAKEKGTLTTTHRHPWLHGPCTVAEGLREDGR